MPIDQAKRRQIKTAALSDVGRVRAANQDICGEFGNSNGYQLLVLADGMGGHAGGETASRLALETIGEVFQAGFDEPRAMLESAFQTANQKVHQTGSADPNLQGMGTTGVAVLIGPHETAWVAHIGDSRAYRLRDGHFEPVTEDHSWVVDAIHHGRITAKEAKTHPMRNVLMRSIGVAPQVEVAISSLDLQIGDRFLLCSDGLWGEVPEASIAEILSQETPSTAVRQLVDLANDHGGSDNVTVQVAELVASESESQLDSRPHQPAATTPTQAAGGLPSSRADSPLPRASSSGVGSHWGSIAAGVLIVLIAFALFWRSCS